MRNPAIPTQHGTTKSPMQTTETPARDTNADRRSFFLRDLGQLSILLCCTAFGGFIIASTFDPNSFWTPAAIAVSLCLGGFFFMAGLLLTILSCSVFNRRARQIGVPATLLLLALVWYPLWGHDTFSLLGRISEQAFVLAEQRFCLLPLIDI